jgi:hypothetical protein
MSNPSTRPGFTPGRRRGLGQRGLLLTASLALLGGAFTVGGPDPAQANTTPLTAGAVRVTASTGAIARPGANLLRNANATVGATSAQGWDAVAIPGWDIQSGLPTVVRYGTEGFPKAAKAPNDPGNLFAGGAGGTATTSATSSATSARPRT